MDVFLPDLGIKDTKATKKLLGYGRMHKAMLYLCGLVRHVCEKSPIVMIFEDLQWYDSKSLEMLYMILTRLSASVAIITTRSVESLGRAYLRVYGYGALNSFKLLPLNRNETVGLVLNVLSCELSQPCAIMQHTCCNFNHHISTAIVLQPCLNCDPALADFVVERTGGAPYFITELTKSMRECKIIEVHVNGRVALSQDHNMHSNMILSEDISAAITSRLDALSARQQLVLKAASVVGMWFNLSLVKTVILSAYKIKVNCLKEVEAMILKDIVYE